MTFLHPIRLAAALTGSLTCALPIAAMACDSEPLIGSVCTFAFNFCPNGFVAADGGTLPIRDNQALFALLGFNYGGDKSTSFGVPDLRGRVAVGTGAGAGLTGVTLAQQFGQQQVVLTQPQTPVAPHTHPATFAPTNGTAAVTIPATPGNLQVTAALPVGTGVGSLSGDTVALGAGQNGYLAGIKGATSVDPVSFNGPYSTSAPGANAAYLQGAVKVDGAPAMPATTVQVPTITGGTVTVNSANALASMPVPTQPPSIGLTVCIASVGYFPSRP